VELEGVPKGLSDVLKYDDPEKQLQFHTGTAGTGGKRPAFFHGHGVGVDDAKDRIPRYFRLVDKGLYEMMHDETSPLVLAGLDHLLAIYREVNSYPQLLDRDISGNPDEMVLEDLQKKLWALVEPYLKRAQADAAERYLNFVGTGKTSNDLEEIVPGAVYGRIAVLFVAMGIQRWGRFKMGSGGVEVHRTQRSGDTDLLDLAAVHTLLKGGEVYVVDSEEVPGHITAAALFRY
jgi:hypothetical protein